MTITHHLPDSLLLAYAAGQLSEAFALVVAAHASLCDECRARIEAYAAVGGAMLEDCAEAPLSDGALAATLARIAEGPKAPIVAPQPRRMPGAVLPAPVRDYVGGDLPAVRWRPAGVGVKQAILARSDSGVVRLLRIPAGTAVPDHGHRGLELTLVLQGAFRDAEGRFARGDVEVASEDVAHMPVAEPGEDCICLAATDAPLRFRAVLPRLVQPLLRI